MEWRLLSPTPRLHVEMQGRHEVNGTRKGEEVHRFVHHCRRRGTRISVCQVSFIHTTMFSNVVVLFDTSSDLNSLWPTQPLSHLEVTLSSRLHLHVPKH